MEKVFIEEKDGWFYAYKVDSLGKSTNLDEFAKSFIEQGCEVRIGGNLSIYKD